MNLSLKATRLVIDALEHYRHCQDQHLHQEGLSEDEISDLINDQLYLDTIKQAMEEHCEELTQQCRGVQANG